MSRKDRASVPQKGQREPAGSVPMIDAAIARMVCEGLRQNGADVEPLLVAVGLPPEILTLGDARIPFRQNVELLELAAQHSGDSHFGLHLAAMMQSQNVGVLGYVATASATVADAAANVKRYYHVLSNAESFDSHTEGDQVVFEYRVLDVSARHSRQNDDMSLMSVLRFMQVITGKRLFAKRFESRHSAPAETTEYSRLLGAELCFGAARNALAFPASVLDLPVHSADDKLLAILKEHCDRLLVQRAQEDDLLRQIEEMVLRLLPSGPPRAETVARDLGMSLRTFSRRLQEHEVTYRDLLDDLRRSLARRYLQDRKLRLSDIAYMLGYADLSAFNHAFNRWTGKSPSEFRNLAA